MSTMLRLASGALLSLAVVSAPAAARPYYGGHYRYHHYHHGGIGVGGALLGAAIIGGIAVAASNADRGPPVYEGDVPPVYDRGPGPDVYGQVDDAPPPVAEANAGPVEDCSRAVERQAQSNGGLARVTGIDRVDPIDGGANVLGTLEVDRGRDRAVERLGWSCRAAYGRVTGVRLG